MEIQTFACPHSWWYCTNKKLNPIFRNMVGCVDHKPSIVVLSNKKINNMDCALVIVERNDI